MPEVWRRNAVGIWTVIVISNLHGDRHVFLPSIHPALQIFVECSDLGRNRFFAFVFPGEHIGSLQTIARDAQHSGLAGMNPPLPIEFVSRSHGHSTCSL